MVGTDLVQAIPLVGAAAIGHWIFGSPQLDLIVSVLIGAIPAVMLGAHFSSRADERLIRPVLVVVLAMSALKLLDVPNAALLALAGGSVLALAGHYAFTRAGYGRSSSSMATLVMTSPTETPSATSIPSTT